MVTDSGSMGPTVPIRASGSRESVYKPPHESVHGGSHGFPGAVWDAGTDRAGYEGARARLPLGPTHEIAHIEIRHTRERK
jgi:hypothetical protein